VNDVVAGALGALAGVVGSYFAFRPNAPRASASSDADAAPVESAPDRVARLVDALPFAAFTVDASARVRVFNSAAAALFGVERARAPGRALIDVVPSVELERMVTAAVGGTTTTRDVVFGAGVRERFIGVTAQPYEGGAIAIASDRTMLLAPEPKRADIIGNL
jgi:transcriptional regulator of aromatic amino acid metabolism